MRLSRWIRRYPATLAALALVLPTASATFLPAHPVAALGWHETGSPHPLLSLVSAHFVHLGAVHLLLNLLFAVALALACDRFGLARQLAVAALVSMAGVDLGLVSGLWPIAWYVGLSGMLYGVFAWLTLSLGRMVRVRRMPQAIGPLAWALYAAGAIKVGLDLAIPVGTPGWHHVALATPVHLYGYSAATLFALLRPPR